MQHIGWMIVTLYLPKIPFGKQALKHDTPQKWELFHKVELTGPKYYNPKGLISDILDCKSK